MSDDDFLNIGRKDSIKSDGIIEKTIHTIQTIRIYPNGSTYILNVKSWTDKNPLKERENVAKGNEIPDTTITEEEVY